VAGGGCCGHTDTLTSNIFFITSSTLGLDSNISAVMGENFCIRYSRQAFSSAVIPGKDNYNISIMVCTHKIFTFLIHTVIKV
jgi:hypothetical protein